MLLRFNVANHLSIRDRQELSLVASSLKDDEAGVIECALVPSGRVLPVAVIYGANASGKSNFVSALSFMRWAILNSQTKSHPGKEVPRKPFALDPTRGEGLSFFEADFVVDGVRYQYGFEASDQAFETEWLYAYPKNHRQHLFSRDFDGFQFGRNLKGRQKIIAELTRPNSLFLSAAAQNSHEQLTKIYEFFESSKIDNDFAIDSLVASSRFLKRGLDSRVIEFLNTIGTGVVDYRRQESELSEQILEMVKILDSVMEKYSKEEFETDFPDDYKRVEIELGHIGKDNNKIYFPLERESAGTRRLLIILHQAFQVLDEGSILVIDELDASLHTHACGALLELFSSPRTNPKGAQLIATTHDTNLMRSPCLRRDQVWLTEKDAGGATHLYPLTDIRTRKGDNIELGYLQGRYGAIPSDTPISELAAKD